MKPVPMQIEQTSPGRYVGAFPARDAGSYFVMISPGAGQAPIRAGMTVPYSDEFRDATPNDALLEQLAATVPKGGPAGKVIELPARFQSDEAESRCPRSTRSATICPRPRAARTLGIIFLLAACCVLFCDVFAGGCMSISPGCRRLRAGPRLDLPPPAEGGHARVHAAVAEPQGRSLRPVGSNARRRPFRAFARSHRKSQRLGKTRCIKRRRRERKARGAVAGRDEAGGKRLHASAAKGKAKGLER